MSEILKTENITVSIDNKTVLENVSLSVNEGELCGVLGLNGSGKTTFLNSIDGLINYSGNIICRNVDIRKLHEEDRAKLISYIHQRTMMKDGISSLDFVLYGLNPFLKFYQFPSADQKEKAKKILCDLGLKEKTFCDFGKLSEGQKQLVILARSVMQNAPLMLLDEPDSSLDYNNRHLLYSIVKKIVSEYNFGGLVSMHDPTFALKYCDKIYLLSNGKTIGEFYTKKTKREDVENALKKIYKNIEVIEHNGEFLVGFNYEN